MINKKKMQELGIKPQDIRRFVEQIEMQEFNINGLRLWEKLNRNAKETKTDKLFNMS